MRRGIAESLFQPPGKNTLSEARYVDWLGVRWSVAVVWQEIPTAPFGSKAEWWAFEFGRTLKDPLESVLFSKCRRTGVLRAGVRFVRPSLVQQQFRGGMVGNLITSRGDEQRKVKHFRKSGTRRDVNRP